MKTMYVMMLTVLCLAAVSANAGYVYTGNTAGVTRFNQPGLDGQTPVIAAAGITDLSANPSGTAIYLTSNGSAYKYDVSGNLLAQSFSGGGFTTIAAGPGPGGVGEYAYVANSGAVYRFDSNLTTGSFTTMFAAANMIDLAVNNNGVYMVDGNWVYRGSLSGGSGGWIQGLNYGFSNVAVGPDGYVYASNATLIGRFNADLTGFVNITSNYGPLYGISDLAVDSTGIYFTSAGRLFRINFGNVGWTGYHRTDPNGYSSVTTVSDPSISIQLIPRYSNYWFRHELSGGIYNGAAWMASVYEQGYGDFSWTLGYYNHPVGPGRTFAALEYDLAGLGDGSAIDYAVIMSVGNMNAVSPISLRFDEIDISASSGGLDVFNTGVLTNLGVVQCSGSSSFSLDVTAALKAAIAAGSKSFKIRITPIFPGSSQYVTAGPVSTFFKLGIRNNSVITPISRGHRLLIDRGLQLQAQVFATESQRWSTANWADSKFTTINTHWGSSAANSMNILGTPGSFMWGKLGGNSLQWTVFDSESPYLPYLLSFCYGDEQDMDSEYWRIDAAKWFARFRTQQGYQNVLVYTNQGGEQCQSANLISYIQLAQPDMVMMDVYPFNGNTELYSADDASARLYRNLAKYRTLGLTGNGQADGLSTPYGLYLQTYVPNTTYSGLPPANYRPSESEIRLNQFAAWTMGYKFASAFVYDSVPHDPSISSLIFSGTYPQYADGTKSIEFGYLATTNQMSRNLGPALVRLISTDVKIKKGTYSDSETSIADWTADADPYIQSISVQNDGGSSVNNGQPGDVLIGYFKPMLMEDDPNQVYFMITNGLSWPGKTAAQTQQTITITFKGSVSSLKRLSRTTGNVETVTLSGNTLVLPLDGGTGDLFKFDNGVPFVSTCGQNGFLAGDVNRDCAVNSADLGVIADNWLNPCEYYLDKGDLNFDCYINLKDFAVLANDWLLIN